MAVEELRISQAKRQLEVTGSVKAGFVSEPKTWVALEDLEGHLSDAALELDGERWDRWSLDVRSHSLANRSSAKGALVARTPISDFGVALDRGDTEVTLDPSHEYFWTLGLR